MMKKHLVEGVVPVLIELKRALEGQQHWLLRDLLAAIRMLLKDYKHEVSMRWSARSEDARQHGGLLASPLVAHGAPAGVLLAATAGGWIHRSCVCKRLNSQSPFLRTRWQAFTRCFKFSSPNIGQ